MTRKLAAFEMASAWKAMIEEFDARQTQEGQPPVVETVAGPDLVTHDNETVVMGVALSEWPVDELLSLPWHMVAHLTDDEKRSILRRAEQEGVTRPQVEEMQTQRTVRQRILDDGVPIWVWEQLWKDEPGGLTRDQAEAKLLRLWQRSDEDE